MFIQPFLTGTSVWDWIGITFVMLTMLFIFMTMLVSGALLVIRSKGVINVFSIVILVYPWILIWDARHDWILMPFWIINAWLLTGSVCFITCKLWRQGIRENFLQLRHLQGILRFWIVYAGAVIALYLHLLPHSVAFSLYALPLALCVLCIPLVSFPAATLSLALQRHR